MTLEQRLQRHQDFGPETDDIFSGRIVMITYDFGDRARTAEIEEDAIAPAGSTTMRSTRYSDRPMDWRTRLGAIAGTTLVMLTMTGAALFTWHFVTPVRPLSTTPLVVTLLPLGAPPEPVREMPEGPEQVEHKQQVERKPPEEIVPKPLIELPKETVTVRPREETPQISDPAPTVPQTSAPKSVAAPTAAQLSSDTRPTWEALLLAHLEEYRRYPARARAARQQGTVYIRFRMNRAGSVLSASILRGSGFEALDQAALETLRRAQPLPAIPTDRPDEVELTIPVEFFVNAAR